MKAECASDTFIYNGKTHSCPISVAMDLTGGKWKAIVLYHLQDGAKRFGELHTHVGGATEAVLSRTLKQLEKRFGIAHRIRQQTAFKVRIRTD